MDNNWTISICHPYDITLDGALDLRFSYQAFVRGKFVLSKRQHRERSRQLLNFMPIGCII